VTPGHAREPPSFSLWFALRGVFSRVRKCSLNKEYLYFGLIAKWFSDFSILG
jgi:hypothetical protein